MISAIAPMLAAASDPFDSPEHFFEVKWDGVRVLTAVAGKSWRQWGRQLADYSGRYPELEALGSLPSGTVLDGEVVVLRNGHADLPAVLQRHQLTNARRIRYASQQSPVHYVLFDLLGQAGRSLLREPFSVRRALLTDLVMKLNAPQLLLSEGIGTCGQRFFESVVDLGHEGVVAKQWSSLYLPGRRSACWQKIKPSQVLPCVIIGYTPCPHGLHSVLLAGVHQGYFRYLGQVTCGLTQGIKARLLGCLARRHRATPFVPCARPAVWVEPDVYCRVRFLQWTVRGRMRSPSFVGLMEPATAAAAVSDSLSRGRQRSR